MTSPRAPRLVFMASLLILLAAAGATLQDRLDPVRQLYAAAQYERALAALDRIKAEPGTASRLDVDRYRVLCLLALQRTREADAAIEAVLTADPLYRPRANDASPAVRSAYGAVRQRLLPSFVRAAYADGREAFHRRQYGDAMAKFERALQLADDPAGGGQPALADLRVLAEGFLQLTRASLGQPVVTDQPLTAAVPTRQEMPQWTFALASAFYEPNLRAVVEVDIDEEGNVTAAAVVQSSHPPYNDVLAKAALAWKYEPARRSGQPAKTRQKVEVVLKAK
jgi:TonB family protein